MHKTWLVASHEYLVNVRRKGFLFASFGMPILLVVLLVAIFALVNELESNAERVGIVGYVDHAGVLAEGIDQPDTFRAFTTEETARAALDADEIGAYFVVPENYLDRGDIRLYGLTETPEFLEDQIEQFLRVNLGASLGDETLARRVASPVDLAIEALDTGRTLTSGAVVGLFALPFIFVMIIMISSQVTSSYLMSGVVEEKTNRIMEVLITSVTPLQLLLGKILGLGALGLTQLAVWLIMGYVGLRLGENTAFLAGITVPLDLVVVGIVYFLLIYLLFASLMAGIGAVAGSEQESRQNAGVFSFLMAVPFFFIVNFITDPNGPIPLILTLIPFTAPITVILRMGFGVIPAWQLIASIVILAITTAFVIVASARVFRWSLLMYGNRPSLRSILRAIRRDPNPRPEPDPAAKPVVESR